MTCSFSKEFSSASVTTVENEFIINYMPSADGIAVKVYLYGLYLCQHPEFDKDLSGMAEFLELKEEQVKSAFKYFEEYGLVSVVSNDPFEVRYMSPKVATSSKPRKYKAEKYTDFTKGIQALLPSRMISVSEYTEYFNVMETYSLKPEIMLMIVKYCVDTKGDGIHSHYILAVAKDFGNRGINTVEQAEREFSSYFTNLSAIQSILSALSSKKKPELEDLNYFNKWVNDLSFEPENIIYAAKSLKRASMAKLDEFLTELYSMKCFGKEEIAEYSKKKQAIYDLTVKFNRALSVYVEVLDTEIDTYISKWLSYGFSGESLLLVANYCFKKGKNNLQFANDLVEDLRKKGFIDLSSVSDYFENEKKDDEFIAKILMTCGINRRPTPWDKDNLSTWKSWNFSNEMILKAAETSAGKSSPIAYMHGILSNWKNNGIFELEGAITTTGVGETSQEEYNREYERRRSIAASKAQKNTERAMELEGFTAVYERLFSIEKDLAIAELSGNKDKLQTFEQEKIDLTVKINKLLSTIGLDLTDLSPKYTCEKCKDTGYVGTHRCDCINKTVK